MTVINLEECNTKCYAVTWQINQSAQVQKIRVISNDENKILYIIPIKTFLGKSKKRDMTLMSGALDKSVFDGNTILLELSEKYGRHRFT